MMNRVSASIFLCYNADRGENKMDEYVSKLKQLLRYEAGRPGRMCGVYDYTQKKVALRSIGRAGGSLSEAKVNRIYDTGCFYADNLGESFSAEEIIETEGCFYALKYCVEHMDERITPEYVKEILCRLYPGALIYMSDELSAFVIESGIPVKLKEVVDFHIRFIQYGGDSRVASLISYMQCINANLIPFIIHSENQETYERYIKISCAGSAFSEMYRVKLCSLLKVEQDRYKEETEPLVINQV